MEYLSGASLMNALLVLIGISGALAAVWKGMEAWGQLTGRKKRAEESDRTRQTLKSLEGRVTACEERFDSAHGDMTQMLTVLNAMLMHFISGNDHDKLRGVKEGLDRYLASR